MKRSFLLILASLFALSAHATEVQEVKTKSGITAWLVEEHSLPLIAVKVAFKDSGYASDKAGKEGRANMAAGMLTEGAGDLDSRRWNEALELKAIRFNVGVDEDLFSTAMESLSEYKKETFAYLGLALTKPRFDKEAIERMRRQTQSIILQAEQEPGYQLKRTWLGLAYGSHPYNRPQMGTNNSIKNLERDDLKFFAAHYLTKENIIVAVAGDITAQELSALIDEHFSALPDKFQPDSPVGEVTVAKNIAKPSIVDFDIPQTIVLFGGQGLKRDDPDYFAAYVMNQIIGGGGNLTSRLSHEIREKRGLAYSVGSFLNPMTHGATWQGQFATRNEKVSEAIDILRSTMKEFAEKGPTDEEIKDAKDYLMGSFVLHIDSNDNIADFLMNMQLNKLGRDYLDVRNSMIAKVTKAQIQAAAKRLINPDTMVITLVGKPVWEKAP